LPSKRGSTIQEIERLLLQYDELRPVERGRRKTLTKLADIDKALTLVYHVHDDCALWWVDHKPEAGVQALRRPGVEWLIEQTRYDRDELEDARGALAKREAEKGRGELPKFVPEKNQFIDSRTGSASSILEGLGTAIGLAIPRPGDEVEAEMSVKIPCDSYGASYVGMKLLASASRADMTSTNITFQASVIGGAQIAGLADMGGELGVFMQSQGATPEQAMKLISWGWYRQLRESKVVPAEIANAMWGGAAGHKGARRSAQWAANVEREAFGNGPGATAGTGRADGKHLSSGVGSEATTDAFVRTGFAGALGAEIGLHEQAGVAVGTEVRAGKHYDRKSLERAKGDKVGAFEEPGTRRGRTQNLSSGFLTVDTSIGISNPLLSGEAGMSLELMYREYEKGKQVPEGYISANGSLDFAFPGNAVLLPLLINAVKEALLPKLEGGVVNINRKAKSDKKAAVVGTGLDAAEASLSEQLGGATMASLGEAAGLGLEMAATTLTVSFAAGYQIGPKFGDAWTFELGLRSGGGIAVATGVANLSMSRSSRLLRIVLAKGDKNWEVDVD
jgi:hypothetical protein